MSIYSNRIIIKHLLISDYRTVSVLRTAYRLVKQNIGICKLYFLQGTYEYESAALVMSHAGFGLST